MFNKINFMYLCYNLMSILQGITSIKDVLFFPFQLKVQVGPKLKRLTSKNKIGTKSQIRKKKLAQPSKNKIKVPDLKLE